MITTSDFHDIETPTGTMRTYVYRPNETGNFPAIIFYSEIFQRTAPIARTATILAGHGFVVLVPEVFHELNPIGTVLGYDDEGKDKGNNDKWTKPLEAHDSDTVALIDFAKSLDYCTGKVGAMGVCIGGHLAFRAALNPNILAASCLYATDIHSDTLPSEKDNDSFSRTGDIKGELQMVWGKQDPHVPDAGRMKIHQQLLSCGNHFSWTEFNAQHAFMRDEGERYDPVLAIRVYTMAVELFQRTLR
ncbi:dienelactone hydrolase family protein [Psychrosphaera sp. B3R10]|uniref:dienelactone hydrolase family protein n=1 Tax=unclassified Psychrosphaera TaxID=2641570 RepID=UPI001C0A28CC|nr:MULTISPECIES: dienelactone hydrolase family protein [unclassified Psychrosphaera]MBU2882126.1 dienelactone hydrolase family protein [Psychrosphaera sp. I2R16]MBU2988807.1 dienelactone hydrolase family protein [Psychrosphaera sp. B3R10]